MDWFIAITLVLIFVMLFLMNRRLTKIEERQKVTLSQLNLFRARQASTAHRVSHGGAVQIDAHGRTTRRDTSDLPATGRMSTAVHREKRDYGRAAADD